MISSSAGAIDQEIGQLNKMRFYQPLSQHSIVSVGIRMDTGAI
jgi:hypothetical protein